MLKKKGYRCELEDDEDDCEDNLGAEKDGKSFDLQTYKVCFYKGCAQ